MTLNLNVPKIQSNLSPRITVIGVGGAGGNAVNNMIQSNLEGVDFLIANTDAQAMQQSLCERQIQLGRNITQGLGAGSRPDIGRAAAEETLDEILSELDGANMAFITAGMGGGTGTGAAPVIARAAREAGMLTVGVITKPFQFEGVHRMRMAEAGIQELTQYVDTLIVIPNQNLFRIANEKTTFADAFKMADDVLHSGVRGVTDLMVMPGLINLDFADIRAVMTEMGKAMMGTGEAEGDNRAIAAAEAAISNPLLDDVSMRGARGVLINITGGHDLTLFEVDEAANRIRDEIDPEANIIFGSIFDDGFEGRMRVSVVATGIEVDAAQAPRPVTLSLVSSQSDSGAGALAEGGQGPTAQAEAEVAAEAANPPAEEVAETPAPAATETADAPADAVAAAPEPQEEPAPAIANSLYDYSRGSVEHEEEAAVRSGPRPAPQAPSAQTRAEEVFIAPPPVEADPVPESASRAMPDPFAAAAIANGSPAARGQRSASTPERRRAQGLFAKMSGAARALHTPGGSAPARAGRAAETRNAAAPAPAARPAAKTAAASPATAAQPRLSGLDPKERVEPSQPDDDLLDIPAFLRRQAN